MKIKFRLYVEPHNERRFRVYLHVRQLHRAGLLSPLRYFRTQNTARIRTRYRVGVATYRRQVERGTWAWRETRLAAAARTSGPVGLTLTSARSRSIISPSCLLAALLLLRLLSRAFIYTFIVPPFSPQLLFVKRYIFAFCG